MGGVESAEATPAEVWPPDWDQLSAEKRKIARDAILQLSALPPAEFLAFSRHKSAITSAEWRFDEYHAAATAAVQASCTSGALKPRALSDAPCGGPTDPR